MLEEETVTQNLKSFLVELASRRTMHTSNRMMKASFSWKLMMKRP